MDDASTVMGEDDQDEQQVILVDTSIWVNHLRRHDGALATHLEAGDVLCHPYVIGEVGLGLLKQRREVLALMAALPSAVVVSHGEVMASWSSVG